MFYRTRQIYAYVVPSVDTDVAHTVEILQERHGLVYQVIIVAADELAISRHVIHVMHRDIPVTAQCQHHFRYWLGADQIHVTKT